LTRVSHRELSNWPAHVQDQINAKLAGQLPAAKAAAQVFEAPPPPKPQTRQRHELGRMNKIERDFSAVLTAMKVRGEMRWWKHEEVKFRLANLCWYIPDFVCLMADGHLEVYECKGFTEGDAAVKLRMFHEEHPEFGLTVVKRAKGGGGWIYDRRR
jgi:hypothetical protein